MPTFARAPNAIVGLTVNRIGLSAGVPGNASPRQQVAFVRRVDELLRPHLQAVFHCDRNNARSVFGHFVQMCEMMNNDLRRLEQLFERGFGFGRAEVALSDLLVELTGDPAADRRVTSIGMTQAARTEAAQMFTE